jgi:hypothetical protein
VLKTAAAALDGVLLHEINQVEGVQVTSSAAIRALVDLP